MGIITNAADAWSSNVTLTRDEFWQVHEGVAGFTTDAGAAAQDGIRVHAPYGIEFKAGVIVRYRRWTAATTVISREAVSP